MRFSLVEFFVIFLRLILELCSLNALFSIFSFSMCDNTKSNCLLSLQPGSAEIALSYLFFSFYVRPFWLGIYCAVEFLW